MSRFEQKDKLDKFLYKTFNIYSDFVFFFKFKLRKYLQRNKKYKDLHSGERCFILATGPSLNSLNDTNINRLKDEIIFAVNSFYKVEKTNEIIPNYYVLFDNLFWEDWSDTFKLISQKYKERRPVFITDYRAIGIVNNLRDEIEDIFLYSKKFPADKISSVLHKNMFIAMNVVSGTILSAIYMGFNEIYLIGTDYNAFCKMGQGHAYNDHSEISQTDYNLAFYLKYYWIGTEIHYLISKYAKERGVKIINLSDQSLLDAYPKMRFDEVFS